MAKRVKEQDLKTLIDVCFFKAYSKLNFTDKDIKIEIVINSIYTKISYTFLSEEDKNYLAGEIHNKFKEKLTEYAGENFTSTLYQDRKEIIIQFHEFELV